MILSRTIKILDRFVLFLLKRIILVLTLMLCVGTGIALSNMSQLSSNLIEYQAIQNATLYTESLEQVTNLYSSEAVDRAKTIKDISVSHTYLSKNGAIPLPSTFAIQLGERISEENPEVTVRLYSDYPFPWRKAKGGIKDAFEKDALTFLRQGTEDTFSRLENRNGHLMFRFGRSSVMRPTCVACHNTDPNSPKKDWEVGDVAGVWEISQPLDKLVGQVGQSLKGTFAMLLGISALGLSGLTLVIGKLQQTAKHLEQRVRDRTLDLAQANVDLEQRNQLIRQVFGRYLSDRVVSNLLDHPENLKLGGERRKITILTSDLRGFTSVSERLQPEQVIQLLNIYLEQMADVINQYEGTIDEFMGDGILVLFGAPIVKDGDAVRAVACACAMQLAMGTVNEMMNNLGLPALEMGIGIHTGEVVVGNIGSEKRTKYGIVGSPVNLTYRIESYTKGGQILISEQTFKETNKNVKVARQLQVQPKGVSQPITIYEVYGIGGFYNIYLPREEEIFLPVPKAIPVQYTILENKHIGEQVFHGQLVKLSLKGCEIYVNSSELPEKFATLKLNLRLANLSSLSEDVYAKVLVKKLDSRCFSVYFTTVPESVRASLNVLYNTLSSGR
jgi:adenylate cyclase